MPCASQAIGLSAGAGSSDGASSPARRGRRATAGSGSSAGVLHASQGPWRAWSANSSAKVCSALRMKPHGAVGVAAGAAAARQRGQRSSRSAALPLAGAREHLLEACPPMRPGRWTHGPHWPALWSDSQVATRTVSATGQAFVREQRDDAGAERGAVRREAVRLTAQRPSSSEPSIQRARSSRRSARRADRMREAARRGDDRGQRCAVLDLIDTGMLRPARTA